MTSSVYSCYAVIHIGANPSTTLVIIIIINDNVYGAILMTMVTARVHPVHLMNAD